MFKTAVFYIHEVCCISYALTTVSKLDFGGGFGVSLNGACFKFLAEKQNKSTPLIKRQEVDHSARDRLTSKCATAEARSNETKWIIALYCY